MIKVIALDLEGTLISNAVSQFPRPGLLDFLNKCKSMCSRVVIFTTVREEVFRAVAKLLVSESCAPDWFETIEYINWHGKTKNLSFIPDVAVDEALLVDDMHLYVHPGQEASWVEISKFEHPYPETDTELSSILNEIQKRM
ncbi:NIF family HAD-type phosphatase [Gilvimarinus sp. SDUM040013]|uniref:NIF family HAD-type phosphatase n=1 Tax=Gilvimarinus gilvus TaxID=3058038 RepID=A0ABU4S3Z9_9GAMM|nr:NIF family HAD-type phosphatase [Gilvimarinus sp. SDUM040013]MDO3384929.1 NIF family HAD-type phosphatase [Gilvimarinus sp. SDUM040013]MDX6851286.1 NIF family HAD-type phosphatase [Gilvimarinus sp. SDUM040013]